MKVRRYSFDGGCLFRVIRQYTIQGIVNEWELQSCGSSSADAVKASLTSNQYFGQNNCHVPTVMQWLVPAGKANEAANAARVSVSVFWRLGMWLM